MSDVGGALADAEAATRELAVYLSYDRDAALRRGDSDAAATLAARCSEAGRLAEELRHLNPDSVAADPRTLAEVRALVDQLRHRLAGLVPEIAAARRAPMQLSVVRGMIGAVGSAVAYLRVSTDRQAEEGFGLEVQEAAVRMWARKNKVRIVGVFVDEGRSGAAEVIDRPGLAGALGEVMAGRAESIVVARLDRLSRELALQEWIRADLIRLNAELRSADDVEDMYLVADPDNPTGTLVRQILGAVAQYERAMIRLRMAAGKAKKGERGGYIGGGPPFGWRAEGGQLVADLQEQAIVAKIRRWRRGGKSYRTIAELLNAAGTPARKGGRWHSQTVARVAARTERNAKAS